MTALIGALLLLVFAAALFLVLYLRASFAWKKTAEELERARSELVALREEKEELEERLGEAQEAAAATERYEELDQNVERESQGDRDWQVEEPALKVSGLEAGAIVEETEF